jgi:hypothetical protein
MVYLDKSPNDKCDGAEGITVSNRRVEWNHESPCGKIDNIQRGKGADNVLVNMTCVDAEGWKNGKPRTSSDLSGCADLVVFQNWRENLYDAEFDERHDL